MRRPLSVAMAAMIGVLGTVILSPAFAMERCSMTVRNGSGSSVGSIDSDGTVRNSAGSSRGRFDSYSSSCAHCAVAYLFFFEPLYNQ